MGAPPRRPRLQRLLVNLQARTRLVERERLPIVRDTKYRPGISSATWTLQPSTLGALPGHARQRWARRRGVRLLAGRAGHAARASKRAGSGQRRATPSSVLAQQGLPSPLVRLRPECPAGQKASLLRHEAVQILLAIQQQGGSRRRLGTACARRGCRTTPGEGGGG